MSEVFSDRFVFALLLVYYLFFQTSYWQFTAIALPEMYHTFGVAVLFWGMLLFSLTRRIWRERFLPLSCVYRINKTHCLFTHSSPVHYCRINAYYQPVLAHVIYLYCIYSPDVHSFCSTLGLGLCCRWELISAVCSQLALVSRVWECTGKVCREVRVRFGRGERGCL